LPGGETTDRNKPGSQPDKGAVFVHQDILALVKVHVSHLLAMEGSDQRKQSGEELVTRTILLA